MNNAIHRVLPLIVVPLFGIVFSEVIEAQEKNPTFLNRHRDGEAIEMILFREPGWTITFLRDGQVKAQFGSGLADNAFMPKGTIDFDELLKSAERLRSDKKIENSSQLAFVRRNPRDERSSYAFYLKDDTLFRYLIGTYKSKWKSQINQEAFEKLLKTYPIFGK